MVLYVYRTFDVQTRRFPYWIMQEFPNVEWLKNPQATIVDFVPLGTLFGPGSPDPDLVQFQIEYKLTDH